ncbi:unnamed protein product [Rhizophagus irregularis]|nr:unnamed protein product [Rhizophagus irregularis]CAB5352210.1 unnamed protein product [Rhizophagus irregularis]
MPCHWLVKGTKEYCTRPTKNEYCGMHAFAINRRGATPPSACLLCGNGTNSVTQICIHCGQHKFRAKLWRERNANVVAKNTMRLTCPRCGKVFPEKAKMQALERHLNRKIPCRPQAGQQATPQPAAQQSVQQAAPQFAAQPTSQDTQPATQTVPPAAQVSPRAHHRTKIPYIYGSYILNEPPSGDIEFTECRTERRDNINGEVCPEDIYENVSGEEEQLVVVKDIMSCWQAVIPSCKNPLYAFNVEIAADDYGKTPYVIQLIEASCEKITEVIQAEFNKKGSQLKTRIVVYCAYEKRSIVEGEISITYTDKYHDGELQVLLANHSIDDFLVRSAEGIDADIEMFMTNGSGWKLLRIEMIYIEFFKYERALGGSFIATPKGLANKKATINPDNRTTGDDFCLPYALGIHFLHFENNGVKS